MSFCVLLMASFGIYSKKMAVEGYPIAHALLLLARSLLLMLRERRLSHWTTYASAVTNRNCDAACICDFERVTRSGEATTSDRLGAAELSPPKRIIQYIQDLLQEK